MNDPLNAVMTAAEAEERWGLQPGTVKKACWDGRIAGRKSGGTWLVTVEMVTQAYGAEPAKCIGCGEMTTYQSSGQHPLCKKCWMEFHNPGDPTE